jgi:CRP/FNR family transcriptional regulator, dissimilatory nitrate respiration regulator
MDLLTVNELPPSLQNAIATRELVAAQPLFYQGDAASAVFIVKTGRLKVIRLSPERRPVTLQIARPSESLGEAALVLDHYPYTAMAEISSEVAVYPKQALLSALQQHSDLAEDLMNRLIQKSLTLMMQLELREIRSAQCRVLQYLRYSAESTHSQQVICDRPLKDMATELGLTPSTLSRALTRLVQEGSIVREQNLIKL